MADQKKQQIEFYLAFISINIWIFIPLAFLKFFN